MPDEMPQDAPFDFDKLVQLVELMEKHGLTEISLRRGEERWRLRRGANAVAAVPAVFPVQIPPPGTGGSAGSSDEKGELAPPPESEPTVTINSPTVGTFYTSASPDDPPFVTVGSQIQPETVVCIVEAMKVFNQIPAEISGTIVEILVKNGDSVEFGQPLFRVRPG